jgi:hypothetical protein
MGIQIISMNLGFKTIRHINNFVILFLLCFTFILLIPLLNFVLVYAQVGLEHSICLEGGRGMGCFVDHLFLWVIAKVNTFNRVHIIFAVHVILV